MQGPGKVTVGKAAALDEQRLALEVRTVVVSHVAAVRRVAMVGEDRDEWLAEMRRRALALVDKIEKRASAATLTEAHRAILAEGRAAIEAAAATLERGVEQEK